jgi:predicted esterase
MENSPMNRGYFLLAPIVLLVLFAVQAPARDEDIPSKEMKAGGDANKRYFLIGPRKDVKAPKEGFGLLLVMPGGDGGEDFHEFVKSVYEEAVPERYLVAQLVSKMWKEEQEIVWPTANDLLPDAKFTTEQFVEAVVADVAKAHPLNARHIFTLSWSSGGPAAYAVSLQKKSPVTGSFIACSVFKPKQLPPLELAKGHAYYLYHSPGDDVCPFGMAKEAVGRLEKAGAKVYLHEYEGGHGWAGDYQVDIHGGIEWLEKNVAAKK